MSARALAPAAVAAVILALGCRPVATSLERAAAPEPLADRDPAAEMFDLLDSLGLPDTRGLPFVRVVFGEQSRDGFLVAETDAEITMIHLLDPVTYVRAPSSKSSGLSIERIGLAAGLRAWLAAARTRESDPGAEIELARVYHAGQELVALVLARAARQHDLHAEYAELLAIAQAPREPRGRGRPSWTERMREALSETLMWDAVLAAGTPRPSRPELRVRFARVAEHFPDTPGGAIATELVRVLDVMSAEDEARAKDTPDPGDAEAQIRALIHELREVNGRQWSQPGGASVLSAPGAAWELVRRGRAAIPAVIAILDDRRLTRTVSFHRDFHYSHRIHRYGDAAREILREITGRDFEDRAEAEAWWARARSMSEVDVLAEGMRSSGRDAGEQARRLFALDRRRGLRELAAALPTASPGARISLLQALAEVPGREARELLRMEVRTGPAIGRVAAARVLAGRGDHAWVPDLRAYLDVALRGADVTVAVRRDLVRVLVEHGEAPGLAAVTALFTRLDLVTRKMLLQNFDEVLHQEPRASKALSDAAMAGMVAALTDDATLAGTWYWWRHVEECVSPRVNELAALLLARHLDLPFSCVDSPLPRARGVVDVHNAVGTRRGYKPLPPPAELVPPASPPGLADARTALVLAGTEADARAALRRFEAHGLAGLRPLVDALSALPASHTARAPGDAAAVRLASTVRAVVIDDGTTAPIDRASVDALAGKPLRVETVSALAERTVRSSSKGHLTIHIHRDGTGLGVTLRIRCNLAEGDSTDSPFVSTVARIDARRVHSSYNVGGRRWDDFEGALREVLASPADRDGEVILDVLWHGNS